MNIDKNANFSDWYNEITKEAELCDLRYNIKGFIVIRPWAMKSIDKIYSFYDRELEATKHNPAFFPSLIHERSFDAESDHVSGFKPEVLWVTEAGDKKLEERYALKPTGETSIYPMYALWVNGASDLPIKIYQKGWVWRHETKATKPFIRGREFLWIEAHNVFANEKETKNQIVEDYEMTRKVIWDDLGIPYIAFRRPQWDKFAGAMDTFAADTLMPDGRVLQIASTHLLGQNFSKAFKIAYMNEKGENEYVWQTCYGPGISRIYIAMVCMHGDDKGAVLPFSVAPIQVIIVPITKKDNEEKIIPDAKELEKRLIEIGIRTQVDLRSNTPGFKFNYWELRGVPLRIEFGERELDSGNVVLVSRD
ncbi:proline--tRNA ligase, partial [Candidatus Micrarchaeota archaeon]|nr:proline--tRNA ligase [Candidatus Micrarchaeota archaeon]